MIEKKLEDNWVSSLRYIFRKVKHAETLPFLFRKAVYVKVRQLNGYEVYLNIINMTSKVNDKLGKQKVESSVKGKRTRSHMITNLLTSFARSVRESILPSGFFSLKKMNY